MKRYMIVWLVGAIITIWLCLCASAQTAVDNVGAQSEHHSWLPLGADRISPEDRDKMPLPFGIGLSYYSSTEKFELSDASISVNGQPIPPQMMVLESVNTVTNSRTLRADAWVLPFLNVYYVNGTFEGVAKDIEAQVYVPMPPIPERILFHGRQSGMGVTLAGGYKSFFASYDWNKSWAKLNLSSGTIPTITQSPRVGVQFGSPEVPVRVYIGGFHENVKGRVIGSTLFPNLGQFDYDLKATPESA